VHCKKDPDHLKLQTKFSDETFDFLFKEQMELNEIYSGAVKY